MVHCPRLRRKHWTRWCPSWKLRFRRASSLCVALRRCCFARVYGVRTITHFNPWPCCGFGDLAWATWKSETRQLQQLMSSSTLVRKRAGEPASTRMEIWSPKEAMELMQVGLAIRKFVHRQIGYSLMILLCWAAAVLQGCARMATFNLVLTCSNTRAIQRLEV